MATYLLGIALLVVLVFAAPVFRKVSHSRMVRRLPIEGATVEPRFWGLDGLRYRRAGWEGEVRFDARHLLFRAKPARAAGDDLRMAKLASRGGRIWAVGDDAVEIAGPRPRTAEELRSFLALCEALIR